ncbi:MAG TPA: hypothetical protein VL918_05470 [Sphingobium sp.]|nr:hypothetical protein [Sphingobium sp.]
MAQQKYRVIQWTTGTLGKIGIRHFVDNPVYDLVGVAAFSADKDGKDAGELAGVAPVGVNATTDLDALLAMDADCVFYTPQQANVDEICRILRAGKNVASPTGYFYPTTTKAEDYAKIEAACQEGGTSYHGSGIHPGFVGDLIPLVLSRITSRVDKVQVYELVNFGHSLAGAVKYMHSMGFGVTEAEFRARPNVLTDSIQFFAESMAQVAEGLGRKIARVSDEIEVGLATKDIQFYDFTIPAGTVAAQHHIWTGMDEDGKPLVVFHAIYTVGYDNIEPVWNLGDIHYKVVIEGDPSSEMLLSGHDGADGIGRPYGYVWTAMAVVNAIPAICDAPPGVLTHADLGLVRPRGVVRG